MHTHTPTFALIVAAGASARLPGEVPKPYVRLGGKTVLQRAIEAFASHPGVDGVRVVIRREDHPLYRQASGMVGQRPPAHSPYALLPCVVGGATRQESVRRGLEALAQHAPARVLIHDAARPLASHALISRVLEALKEYPAVLPALPVADTLRRGAAVVDREGIMAAQTPQGFQFDAILAAHARFRSEMVTDDIALAEMAGLAVGVVAGDRANIKLTTPEDLPFMEQLAARADMRVGMGLDVHGFVPHHPDTPPASRVVTVCGVRIPFEQKLAGHSDADVGLHAIVDAMLGAIGAGDIGQHFPPDDPKWAGADSSRFLLHAYQLVKAGGGEVAHMDVTIIGEQPRISPHREAMRTRVADLLKLAPECVNIKATTTEKLGFLGRGEGLAAQAVVTVRV